MITPESYLYSIKLYKSKLFEHIEYSCDMVSIKEKEQLIETLFNIVIITINFLQILEKKNMEMIINENRTLFINKNKDYGDSFRDFELIGLIVRLNDKVNRLITLLEKKETCCVNESLLDTLNDLYNYGIISLMYK